MKRHLIISLVLAAPLAYTVAQAEMLNPVVGQKVDSELGNLPAYVYWHQHPSLKRFVVMEIRSAEGVKIDSGLGDLPPYGQWSHHPELRRFTSAEVAGL